MIPITWTGYLIISCNRDHIKRYPSTASYWKPTARLAVNKPSVSPTEVAVKIKISLPSTLFIRPSLQAKITVPDNATLPPVMDLEVVDEIEKLITANTGFDVKLILPDAQNP